MPDLGIELVDVFKDIASALGVPIISPVLTGVFSSLKKVLEHAKVSYKKY